MRKPVLLLVGCLAALLCVCGPAAAHYLGQSYIYLWVYDDRVEGRVELALSEVNTLLGSELKTDRSATPAELAAVSEQLQSLMAEKLEVLSEGQSLKLELKPPRLVELEIAQYAVTDFVIKGPPPSKLEFDYRLMEGLDSAHTCGIVVYQNWKGGTFQNEAEVSLVLTQNRPKQTLELGEGSTLQGFQGMVLLGVEHIIFGFDHVLFLFSLLLPAVMLRNEGDQWEPVESFKASAWNVLKIVTVFTLSHSVTLSLAALEIVTLPSRLVESLIALSIAVAAFDILRPVFRSRLWLVVFVFGLFHGFGFATILSEMAIPGKYMVLSLLGFNLGVELGQIAILCVVLPILYVLRSSEIYRKIGLVVLPVVLILIAGYWFTERAFDIDLSLGAWIYTLTGFRL